MSTNHTESFFALINHYVLLLFLLIWWLFQFQKLASLSIYSSNILCSFVLLKLLKLAVVLIDNHTNTIEIRIFSKYNIIFLIQVINLEHMSLFPNVFTLYVIKFFPDIVFGFKFLQLFDLYTIWKYQITHIIVHVLLIFIFEYLCKNFWAKLVGLVLFKLLKVLFVIKVVTYDHKFLNKILSLSPFAHTWL